MHEFQDLLLLNVGGSFCSSDLLHLCGEEESQ